jgi:hypothetical protein
MKNKVLSRRDALKLAGTATAFCASFGFLHREGEAGLGIASQVRKQVDQQAALQQHMQKWNQAQIKWYAGNRVLATSNIPGAVLKHLQGDMNASVMIKFDGKFEGKHHFHRTQVRVDAKW